MPRDLPRNAFEGVTDYFSELNRMRQTGVHGREAAVTEERERTHASAWVPTTDIYARGDDLVIVMEVAGVAPEDIDLRFSQGVLTVSGARSSTPHAQGDHYFVRERFYGAFRRAITLPDDVEGPDISAEFDEGLVQITVAGGAVHDDEGRIELKTTRQKAVRRTLG